MDQLGRRSAANRNAWNGVMRAFSRRARRQRNVVTLTAES
jgi:hypothetical protein